jgi:HK97 family phage portal protein
MDRIASAWAHIDELIAERTERTEWTPLEGTLMSLGNSIIPNWWAENITGTMLLGDASLADRLWIASSCQHKNAQQISSMPLQFHGTDEPAWVSNPDPNMFPNGIGDAMYSIVDQLYGWGFACLWVTSRYADGFPRTWTVLDSANMNIKFEMGSREYRYGAGETPLDPTRVIQIDRNPGLRTHGTSAIRAYAQLGNGLLAAGNQSLNVTQGGIPQAVLKSQRKLTKEQAETLQAQWMDATSARNGAPPVLPPELDFSVLSINPADLALIETQQWDAMMVCNAYGMPSVLMNMALAGGLTYQNPAALGEFWWRFELRNVATRIANALSAQMLARGQWVSMDAADTFAPLTEMSDDDDEQASQVAKASPSQQTPKLAAIGGTG